jgi:tRNA pseudouridine55 synthase
VADLHDAYCQELRRTGIGPFSVEDADPDRVLAPARALEFLPARELGEDEARRVANGVKLALAPDDRPAGPLRLMQDGHLVAVAEARDQLLRPVVVFAP